MSVACYQDEIYGGILSLARNGNEDAPSTPAFPLPPETPYGKEVLSSISFFILIIQLTFYLLLKRNYIFPSVLVRTPPLYHQQISSSQKVISPPGLYKTSPGKGLILHNNFKQNCVWRQLTWYWLFLYVRKISAPIGLFNHLSPKKKQRKVFSFHYSNKGRVYWSIPLWGLSKYRGTQPLDTSIQFSQFGRFQLFIRLQWTTF